jgi:hypothetical protein
MFDFRCSETNIEHRKSDIENQIPKLSSEDDFFLNVIRTLEAIMAMAINESVRIVYQFRTRE